MRLLRFLRPPEPPADPLQESEGRRFVREFRGGAATELAVVLAVVAAIALTAFGLVWLLVALALFLTMRAGWKWRKVLLAQRNEAREAVTQAADRAAEVGQNHGQQLDQVVAEAAQERERAAGWLREKEQELERVRASYEEQLEQLMKSVRRREEEIQATRQAEAAASAGVTALAAAYEHVLPAFQRVLLDAEPDSIAQAREAFGGWCFVYTDVFASVGITGFALGPEELNAAEGVGLDAALNDAPLEVLRAAFERRLAMMQAALRGSRSLTTGWRWPPREDVDV